ncbi:hypothetical protein GUG52_09605, partial [Xanthomonas citri pv. citri]|nr:hypothetical protein [Xanthomonas citri pv. citri]
IKKIDQLQQQIELNERNYKKAGSDIAAYKATAGEVEARNVQSRLAMTDEEKKNTSPAETEDVGRYEQIVLFHSASAD